MERLAFLYLESVTHSVYKKFFRCCGIAPVSILPLKTHKASGKRGYGISQTNIKSQKTKTKSKTKTKNQKGT